MQGLLAVANWAAENDKAIVDKPIHECRVPGPALLVPDLTRGVPAWAVDQSHREIGHDRSVRVIADIRDCSLCGEQRQPSERPVIPLWVWFRHGQQAWTCSPIP